MYRSECLGRSPQRLLTMADDIFASICENSKTTLSTHLAQVDAAMVTAVDAKALVSEDYYRPRLEDPSASWRNVWSSVSTKIAESHFFGRPADASEETAFAKIVQELNQGTSQLFSDYHEAIKDCHPDLVYLWGVLLTIISELDTSRSITSRIRGAKRFFEDRFREDITRKATELGMTTGKTSDEIRIVVHGLVGHNDSVYPHWMLIYHAIRCGDCDAGLEFARRAQFPRGCRCQPPAYYFEQLKQRDDHDASLRFADLEQACEQLMRHGGRNKLQSEYRYMIMVVSFLCGYIHIADALISQSAQKWESLDEWLWYGLGCVRHYTTSSSSCFDYRRFWSRLSAYDESYYSGNGQSPVTYAVVLFAGLRFGSGLHYMLNKDLAACTGHVVHMAIAMQDHGLFDLEIVSDPKRLESEDIADLVLQYGRSLAASKGALASEYFVHAQKIQYPRTRSTVEHMAEALEDLLVRSGDFELLETGCAIQDEFRGENERCRVLQYAADICLRKKNFDMAIRLYKTAQNYEKAVEACNLMISDLLIQLSRFTGTAEEFKRKKKIIDIENVLRHAKEMSQIVREETAVLEIIVNVFKAYFKGKTIEVLDLVGQLSFLPTERDEIEEKVRQLMENFLIAVPLLSPLLCFFCEAIKEKQNAVNSVPDETLVVQLKLYHGFISKLPPPFLDTEKTKASLLEALSHLQR